MVKRRKLPVALTIAGSDSGGGAGIQADLKTFAALGVHGTSAITCLSAQNPKRVLSLEPCPARFVHQQIEAVFEELRPAAVKTGMLFSAENVRVVAKLLGARSAYPHVPLVVDPILVSTSGTRLLEPKALQVLKAKLLPLATLVTPNLSEAELLAGRKITGVDSMRVAARHIHRRFGCAALVKGGHLSCAHEAVDIFFDGRTEWLLTAPFVKGIRTHGTGCTCSAAVTALLARGFPLPQAVRRAKEFVAQAIAASYRIGRHFALNHQV